jgi:PAS domain S-box-containing protein
LHRRGIDERSFSIRDWPLWAQYALSLGAVMVALLVRLPLNPALGDRVPFITIFMVMLPLVLLVRSGPFLCAALVGLAGVMFAFRPRFLTGDASGLIEMMLFVLAAAAATVTARLSQRAQQHMRHNEEMLRDSAMRYRAVMDTALDCIVTIDHQGKIVDFNHAAEQTFGYRRADVLGREMAELIIPPAMRERHRGGLARYLATGEGPVLNKRLEMTAVRADGNEFPVELAITRIPSDGPPQFTGYLRDITERKQADDRLQTALATRTAEVQRAEKALATAQRLASVGTFASGLAHDITNITLPLGTRLDPLLKAPNLTDEQRSNFSVILALLDHLRIMAKNLSLFARDPEQEGIIGSTELASWCANVHGLLESSLGGPHGDSRVRLKCDIPAGLPAVAIAPHRLTQAALNLVHNARDAILAKQHAQGCAKTNGHAGSITIEAAANSSESAVALKVIDDGLGMTPDVLRRAIEPFFTTKDRPTAAGVAGSGMGLSLVHAICARAGGTLDIDSQPGKGTTITLTLPVAQPAPRTAETAAHVNLRSHS